ncbi:SMI1/KNR4 family protein [Streptomyces sp. NPDC048445]|uniref:SMI1/KNR4 family protein n=1 Tax=Streptomyces sp. NPDC048445 TaxID=3365553 RepID=UPI00372033B8
MNDASFNWSDFLGRWQEEWVPRDDEDDDDDGAGTPVRLGAPGAGEGAIAAAEARLGKRLPPSYREFLAVSDGWNVDQMAGVYRLGGVADIGWFQDPYDLAQLYEENLDEEPREEDVLLAGMWRRALQLETESDASFALLDPGDRGRDGEWALYVYKGWSGEFPERYESFRAYMEAMYRGFHGRRAGMPDFVNATTRTQDARVEEARLLALRGRYEVALPLLEEALSFGRPRSADLLNQLRHLTAPGGDRDYGLLVADPRCLPELLPLHAREPARRGGDDHWLGMMAARGVARDTAEAVLRAMRDGSHRYEPPGAWGRAVSRARDSARWGETDAAWRVLREALPRWEAPGPTLIAPVGLLADPVLGQLVTPERGREILATPRAGETGPAPGPVPDLDPPGLAWLTGPQAHRPPFDGYRCVWVEGADPTLLPALLGEEDATLSVPVDQRMVPWRMPEDDTREPPQPWEDRGVATVGRTAGAWTFAFDGHPQFLNDRFVSPAAAASASGRAAVLWRDPDRPAPGGRLTFHLSVAEQGQELYAFTVRGTEIQRSGAIPEALDPERLFRPEDPAPDNELRALEALHTELGLALPRFALTRGRLSTFTPRSWTRAPREGESFAYLRMVRHRHRH